MELCKGFLYSETLPKLLMRHAQSCFSILGGQLPVTCERCNVCTVTGVGTSFWNIVRHSFTIYFTHAVCFYKDLCFVKHNHLIFEVRGKDHYKFNTAVICN